MSKIDYQIMSDREFKQYFLAHRDDKEAFEAYLDRRHRKPQKILIEAGEIDNLPFSEQVAIVAKRLSERFLNQSEKR
jgi:hypothetical protein